MRENFKQLLTTVGRAIRWFNFSDLVFVAGAAAVGYGLALIYKPLAFIVVGTFFVILTTYGRFKP